MYIDTKMPMRSKGQHIHMYIKCTQLARSHNNHHNNENLSKLSSAVVAAKIVTRKTRSNNVTIMPLHTHTYTCAC